MAIAKDEIEKYIFDPENPKQCKSYKLLLRIAKRENVVFFSPYFLQYFLGQDLLDGKFKDELWDIPDNYDTLSFQEKIDFYISQLSEADFEEYKESLTENDIPFYNIMRYSFWDKFLSIYLRGSIVNNQYVHNYKFDYNDRNDIVEVLKKLIFEDEEEYNTRFNYEETTSVHHIFFLKNHFEILKTNIEKSSISISLEEDIEQYLEFENDNVKPIFLKKIEDVDILLNVLQQDIHDIRHVNLVKEEIVTIESIEIKDFFSIENIKLEGLSDKKEIYVVGENGDGKTLLLQSIAVGTRGTGKGAVVDLLDTHTNYSIETIDSNGNSNKLNNNMFAYGSSRNNHCNAEEDETGYLTLFNSKKFSVTLKDAEKWLIYLDHKEKKSLILMIKTTLKTLLGDEVKITITPDELTFTERGANDVSFKQLSAGYRSVITLICDLIEKLSRTQSYVSSTKEYEGIVLIDEIELHLHPKWKYNFMKKLRDTFPLIQFIVTTHSPTVILGASKEAVFYKIYKDNGKVTISNQIANEGYTNNSLVSSPLFDMETITSREYDKKVSSDDYIYEKIHKQVAQKIKENINVDEEELLKLIDEELDKI